MSPELDTPVQVTVIGTGVANLTGTGTGSGDLQSGTLVTPGEQPNVIVKVIGPVRAMFVRAVHIFLKTLFGLLSAGGLTDVIPFTDFRDLFVKCALLSLSAVAVGVIKDMITIFGDLENKYPLLSGNGG